MTIQSTRMWRRFVPDKSLVIRRSSLANPERASNPRKGLTIGPTTKDERPTIRN